MLGGLEFYYAKDQRLVIVAEDEAQISKAVKILSKTWKPNLTIMGNQGKVDPFNKTLNPTNKKPTFYYCEGKTCQPPTNSMTELDEYIR